MKNKSAFIKVRIKNFPPDPKILFNLILIHKQIFFISVKSLISFLVLVIHLLILNIYFLRDFSFFNLERLY